MKKSNIRPSISSDLKSAKTIIDAVDLFPAELLDSMFSAESDEPEFWLTYDDGSPSAITYCAPEVMTVGTWNLLLIAVHPDRQGEGIGSRLMSHIESRLSATGARVLLVETSGTDEFAKIRWFYAQRGYDEEARIRDYYDAGDDKVVFRKKL